MSIYADYQDIQGLINHIANFSAASTFSPTGDTSNKADKRYSDGAITVARRAAAYQIFSAIGSDASNEYFSGLADYVELAYGADIPASFGNGMGIPQISPFDGADWMSGLEADVDKIESYRLNANSSYNNFYGDQEDGTPHNEESAESALSPLSLRYSTSGGVIKFTGFACRVRLILVPEAVAAEETMADEKIPLHLAHLNVKLALPYIAKEGDSLMRTAQWLGEIGRAELEQVRGGAIKVNPIDVNRAIQMGQRFNQ